MYLKIQFSNCEAPGMEKLTFLQHAARILTQKMVLFSNLYISFYIK